MLVIIMIRETEKWQKKKDNFKCFRLKNNISTKIFKFTIT